MTDKEKAIVTAFTGVSMLEGEKFGIFHEYIEKVCGRPIWTHELADKRVWDEIKEKSKDDFLSVCRSEDPLDRVLEIVDERIKALDGRVPTVRFAYQSLRKDVEKLRGE